MGTTNSLNSFQYIAQMLRVVVSCVLCFIALFLFSSLAYAGKNVVVYPIYHNDADRVITEILDGLHEQLGSITEIAVDTALEDRAIRGQIASFSDQDVIIALTSEMGELVRSSGFKRLLVEGASEGGASAPPVARIGIQPSPEKYIRSLKKLHAGVNRLFYFYSDDMNDAQMNGVRDISGQLGIEVKLIAADNINDAMNRINDVVKNSDPDTDAIWIPHHILSMANNTMLRFVLGESWKKSLIVFTDSLDSVARGLLFTLTPDYRAYGAFLGKYASSLKKRNGSFVAETIPYFDDVYLMVNQRFSVHIGLNINRSMFDKYKIVVPAK